MRRKSGRTRLSFLQTYQRYSISPRTHIGISCRVKSVYPPFLYNTLIKWFKKDNIIVASFSFLSVQLFMTMD